MEKPAKYNGKDLSKFKSWWEFIKKYISVNQDGFPNDKV